MKTSKTPLNQARGAHEIAVEIVDRWFKWRISELARTGTYPINDAIKLDGMIADAIEADRAAHATRVYTQEQIKETK